MGYLINYNHNVTCLMSMGCISVKLCFRSPLQVLCLDECSDGDYDQLGICNGRRHLLYRLGLLGASSKVLLKVVADCRCHIQKIIFTIIVDVSQLMATEKEKWSGKRENMNSMCVEDYTSVFWL